MRYLAAILCALLAVVAVYAGTTTVVVMRSTGGGGGGTAVSDDFNRTNAEDLGANWSVASGVSFDIDTNRLSMVDGIGYNYWSANTFANDQYSQATLSAVGDSSRPGVTVRAATGAATAYWGMIQTVDESGYDDWACFAAIRYCNAGDCSTGIGTDYRLGTGICTAFDDVPFRLEVSGTSLTFKVNGTTRVTGTHSALTGGRAGLSTNSGGGGFAEDWSGGDL